MEVELLFAGGHLCTLEWLSPFLPGMVTALQLPAQAIPVDGGGEMKTVASGVGFSVFLEGTVQGVWELCATTPL